MNFETKHNLYSSGEIKREAKAQLKGQWKPAVIMALIPAVFSFIFLRLTVDTDIFSILVNFIRAFLITGLSFGFLNLLRKKNYLLEPLQELLAPFQSQYFLKLIQLKLLKYLFTFFWSLLFIIPGLVKLYAYSQAELIYKDTVDQTGEQPGAKTCLDESQKVMKGHKMDLFVLELSFIGWQILSLFTFGILNLWITPYITMSRVVFYENITEGHYTKGEYRGDETKNPFEEVGKDPDDFRDFEDF